MTRWMHWAQGWIAELPRPPDEFRVETCCPFHSSVPFFFPLFCSLQQLSHFLSKPQTAPLFLLAPGMSSLQMASTISAVGSPLLGLSWSGRFTYSPIGSKKLEISVLEFFFFFKNVHLLCEYVFVHAYTHVGKSENNFVGVGSLLEP